MRLSEFRYVALCVLMTLSCFVGCGTEEESDHSDDVGRSDVGDTDAGEIDAGETDASGCTTPDPSASCVETGCPDGQSCEAVPDGCAPSACSCSDGAWACTADCGPQYACIDDDLEPACPGPNPSITCEDTGCDEGQACVEVDGCTPSSCVCTADGWACDEVCGPTFACMDEMPPAPGCPETEPDIRGACDEEGLECAWGTECCCGDCYDSLVCTCTDGGWACYATDACFIDSCAGRTCADDTDCEGGGSESTCDGGICRPLDLACDGSDPDTCESTFGCEWIQPSACPEGGTEGIADAICAHDIRCRDDVDCPVGFGCAEREVAPRCYWDEPQCDACSEVRTICTPL